jgi:quercetin dioxygenase-like cupin family protein
MEIGMRPNQAAFPRLVILAGALLASLTPGLVSFALAEEHVGRATLAFSSPLPNAPGKSLTAVVVRYGPGEASPPHHHAGSVYAYVLSGMIRSQTSVGGPAKVYQAGESFFEPPGSVHLVSANASATEPASLLAIFVADEGAVLTAPEK